DVTVSLFNISGLNDGLSEESVKLTNLPNPLSESTDIIFILPAVSEIRLSLCDVYGREIAMLKEGSAAAGFNSVRFSASVHNLASGIYFYTLKLNGITISKPMVVLR
ncbi:MAG: hypothetical protein QG635_476, partial [Bacteroidota bacterium]|nr:hypothetical protein [Bacteroidota bacterium]